MMTRDEMIALLGELVAAQAPSGDEREIDPLILHQFEATGASVWQDRSTNIYAHLPGDGPRVLIAAHKDEIGFVVNDILPDGRIKVERVGGSYPWKYGEGPVEILADDGSTLRALLSVGSIHTRTGTMAALREEKAVRWEHVTLFTGLAPDAIKGRGVHVGSRGTVARERKSVERFGDFIAAFALDDRMGLVSLIAALQDCAKNPRPLDLMFVATTGEEIGLLGAVYAAQQIQPEIAIALDTSPVTPDDPLAVDERPVIWYKESTFHDKLASDRLLHLADDLGFGAQGAIYNAAGSDAGAIKRQGLAASTLAFGFARDNSHGFEIAHQDSMSNVARLLLAYLDDVAAG